MVIGNWYGNLLVAYLNSKWALYDQFTQLPFYGSLWKRLFFKKKRQIFLWMESYEKGLDLWSSNMGQTPLIRWWSKWHRRFWPTFGWGKITCCINIRGVDLWESQAFISSFRADAFRRISDGFEEQWLEIATENKEWGNALSKSPILGLIWLKSLGLQGGFVENAPILRKFWCQIYCRWPAGDQHEKGDTTTKNTDLTRVTRIAMHSSE